MSICMDLDGFPQLSEHLSASAEAQNAPEADRRTTGHHHPRAVCCRVSVVHSPDVLLRDAARRLRSMDRLRS